MSDADAYLRELRRALPVACRRRFVAEVREHFASAIAAEAERGVDRAEAERLTIERLGPARAVAAQLLADLRSGALGRMARLTAALTTARLVASGAAVIAAVAAVAVFSGRHSSPVPPTTPERTARPSITVDPRTGEVRAVMHAVQQATREHSSSMTLTPKAVQFFLSPVQPPMKRAAGTQ